ncbi:MAG: helix-hairpin-helix domain-containing protein [Methylococcaceae bacterium]
MKTKVDFILSANVIADATSGLLLGDFNQWHQENGISLKKKKDGSFKTTLELKVGETYEYRYLLDDGRWVNDDRVGQDTENCVVVVSVAVKKPDDLTKIEGIGKKIAELLVAENIVTFADLSSTNVKTLQKILDAAGNRFKIYNPVAWSKQALLAASGKWDELKTLQKELKSKKE